LLDSLLQENNVIMEWFFTALGGLNATTVREGVELSFESFSDLCVCVYRHVLDQAVLPAARVFLRGAESAVKYTLNGEYARYEEVTTQSFYSTLSWLQLSTFQQKLVGEFSVIIIGNCLLVILAWRWYGGRIRTHFMLSDEGQRLEDRVSCSSLQLPREKDFKF